MLNEDRLPADLQVERIGRLWYVILPDEEPALLTVGYARVSSHEQKPQLEPQANVCGRMLDRMGLRWIELFPR